VEVITIPHPLGPNWQTQLFLNHLGKKEKLKNWTASPLPAGETMAPRRLEYGFKAKIHSMNRLHVDIILWSNEKFWWELRISRQKLCTWPYNIIPLPRGERLGEGSIMFLDVYE
jgi:hypothetical protein